MPAVRQLTKRLETRPQVPQLPDVTLRHFCGPEDIPIWLELRHRAFARQRVGVRQWDAGDFEVEYLQKPWWKPETLWLAELADDRPGRRLPIGTVTLAWRGSGATAKPVVHWLAVLPGYRRHGVGRLLMTTLEAYVWDRGYRQVWLETHEGWSEAARLYAAMGYRPS